MKGYYRKSRKDADGSLKRYWGPVYIDKMLLQEAKRRKKSLAMRWTNYRKAYEMVPGSWVIESLNMIGIAKNVVNVLGKTIKWWRVELTCGAETLGEVPIKREIFHRDVLSPLLFVIALIPLTRIVRTANPGYEFRTGETKNHLLFMDDLKLYSKSERVLDSFSHTVRIFSEEIGMQFGIDKCVMLVMKKENIVKSNGIQLPKDKVIKSLEKGESSKYLGVLEADEVMVNEMTDKGKKECYRRVRKVLETTLNSGDVFKAINI